MLDSYTLLQPDSFIPVSPSPRKTAAATSLSSTTEWLMQVFWYLEGTERSTLWLHSETGVPQATSSSQPPAQALGPARADGMQ